MAEHYVISIGREYGCGGREIGRRVSEKLNIGFYDKAILKMTAEKSGIRESYFHLADEMPGGNLLQKIIGSMVGKKDRGPSLEAGELLKPENLFRFQSEVIQKLAEGESCVIMGRCADMVLKEKRELIRIYLYADMEYRIQHVKEEKIFPEGQEEKNIRRMDRERGEYYKYYTGRDWGDRDLYDLMMDTSGLNVEGAADVLIEYVRKRGYSGLT